MGSNKKFCPEEGDLVETSTGLAQITKVPAGPGLAYEVLYLLSGKTSDVAIADLRDPDAPDDDVATEAVGNRVEVDDNISQSPYGSEASLPTPEANHDIAAEVNDHPAALDCDGNHLARGSRVVARFRGQSQSWYPGMIVEIRTTDGGYCFDIAYDDGDKETGALPEFVARDDGDESDDESARTRNERRAEERQQFPDSASHPIAPTGGAGDSYDGIDESASPGADGSRSKEGATLGQQQLSRHDNHSDDDEDDERSVTGREDALPPPPELGTPRTPLPLSREHEGSRGAAGTSDGSYGENDDDDGGAGYQEAQQNSCMPEAQEGALGDDCVQAWDDGPPPLDAHGQPLSLGFRVLARYRGMSKRLFPGAVAGWFWEGGACFIDVDYDDGDTDDGLPRECVFADDYRCSEGDASEDDGHAEPAAGEWRSESSAEEDTAASFAPHGDHLRGADAGSWESAGHGGDDEPDGGHGHGVEPIALLASLSSPMPPPHSFFCSAPSTDLASAGTASAWTTTARGRRDSAFPPGGGDRDASGRGLVSPDHAHDHDRGDKDGDGGDVTDEHPRVQHRSATQHRELGRRTRLPDTSKQGEIRANVSEAQPFFETGRQSKSSAAQRDYPPVVSHRTGGLPAPHGALLTPLEELRDPPLRPSSSLRRRSFAGHTTTARRAGAPHRSPSRPRIQQERVSGRHRPNGCWRRRHAAHAPSGGPPLDVAALGRLARELAAVRSRAAPLLVRCFHTSLLALAGTGAGASVAAEPGGGYRRETQTPPTTAVTCGDAATATWLIGCIRAAAAVRRDPCFDAADPVVTVGTLTLRDGLAAAGLPLGASPLAVLRSAFRLRCAPLDGGPRPADTARTGSGAADHAVIAVLPLAALLCGPEHQADALLRHVDRLAAARSGRKAS